MSYYYNYYVGYKQDGKIYPWGPYDAKGNLHPVVCKSRSFASDLHESFYTVAEKEISDELRKEFEWTDWNNEKHIDVKFLPVKELPETDFIEKGYFLISDVKIYEDEENPYFVEDIFCDRISPQVYTALLDKQLKFGENKPKKNDEGNEYTEHNASDYMWYAYPDFNSKEYEAFMILKAIDILEEFMPNEVEWVVLETEG